MSNDVYQVGRLMSLMYNHIADDPQKQQLYDIIAKACHVDPMKRYRSARFLFETPQKSFSADPKSQNRFRTLMLGLYPPLEDFDEEVPTIVSRTVRSTMENKDVTHSQGERILSETTIGLLPGYGFGKANPTTDGHKVRSENTSNISPKLLSYM